MYRGRLDKPGSYSFTSPKAEEGERQQNVIVKSAQGFWGKTKGVLNPSAESSDENKEQVAAPGASEEQL